jgi:translation initiation factor IF-3
MRKSFRGHKQKPEGPKEFRINEQIPAPELVVIDENGVSLGTISREDALAEAKIRELDLVEVSPKAVPPIAKFIDYGSFKYQKEKQDRKNKAKQNAVETKTIKLSLRIGDHDLEVRANQGTKFLEDGDKVKIELQLRGRENQHADLAKASIWKMVEKIKEKLGPDKSLKTETEVSRMGGRLSLNISL